jgi:superfamily II DNA helicase RecQ
VSRGTKVLIKILSLTFDSARGGFNDDELRDFIKDKEIVSIRDHVFVRNEVPYLTLVIKYFPLRAEIDPKMEVRGKRDEPWREMLTEADMGLFNLLRDWRSQRCKKEGVPPYVLVTNVQLAHIVKSRPQSLAELMKIEGVGKAKADKYGEDILKISKITLAPPPEKVANKSGENTDEPTSEKVSE